MHSKALIPGIIVGVAVTVWCEWAKEASLASVAKGDPYKDSVNWLMSYFWALMANVLTVATFEAAIAALGASDQAEKYAWILDDHHPSRAESCDSVAEEVKVKWSTDDDGRPVQHLSRLVSVRRALF